MLTAICRLFKVGRLAAYESQAKQEGSDARPLLLRRQAQSVDVIDEIKQLLQTCKANGIDGYTYLRRLLTGLPKASTADDYEALLTWSIGVTAN